MLSYVEAGWFTKEGEEMRDFLLLAAMAVVFVFTGFLMKRLDDFLEYTRQVHDVEVLSGKDTLRIGFSNPLFSGSMADVLDRYSQKYDDISVRIFYGTEAELLKQLISYKLDIIFLPENVDVLSDVRYNVKEVSLSTPLVGMKYGGLPMEPVSDENIVQKILWMKEAKTPFAEPFIKCIKKEFAAAEPQK